MTRPTRRTRTKYEAPAPGVQVVRLKASDAVRYRARRWFEGKAIVGPLRQDLRDAITDSLEIEKRREALPKQVLTFRGAVQKARETLVAGGRRYATIAWFDRRAVQPLAYFGDLPVHRIGEDEIAGYVRSRRASSPDLSNNSLQHDRRFLSLVFGPPLRAGQITRNPVKLFAWPRVEETLPDVLMPDELARIVRAIREKGDEIGAAVIVFLCGTGLRLSEAARLKVGDIDLEHGTLRVTKAKRQPRQIALRPELGATVKLLVGDRNRWKQRHGEYVFAPVTDEGITDSKKGKPAAEVAHERRTETINRVLWRWSEVLGEKRLHAHALRHSCGVALAMAGWTPYQIRDYLGHKGLQMVSHYTRQAPSGRGSFANVALPV